MPVASTSSRPLLTARILPISLALGLCAPACGDAPGVRPTEAGSTTNTTGTAGPGTTSDGTGSGTGTGAGGTTSDAAPTTSGDPATGDPDPGTTTGGATESSATGTATTDPETTGETTNPDTTGRETTSGETGEEPGGGMSTGHPANIAGYPVWVHFTDPLSYEGNDRTILNETIRLINDTPDDGTIHAAIHSLTVNGVQNALTAAKARGVQVRVVEDGSDQFDEDTSPIELHAALGADHIWCGDGKEVGNHGCITSDPSGIMHTKLYTFSQTRDPEGVLRDNVVWFGSANMTNATGAKTFNNTVTIYGDAALFGEFEVYFEQLWSQKHYGDNNFYDAMAGRGYFVTETVRVYASPEQDGDLVYNRLNDIVADDTCRVRVAQSMIFDSRLNLVDLLVKLKQDGCDVWVVGSNIQDQALAKLKAGKIPVRKNITHDKTILVNAKFADSPDNRFLVFTGSHNWTQSANYRNDEIFVRLENQAVYDAFYMHFNDAYNTGAAL